ncbi:MAG: guanylate kinase [Chloroflexi bacterium]|nr:guanylate kinase [Chloroflexota bacterium]
MAAAGPAPLLAVITGPSGVGKDSLLSRLKSLNRPYHFAVTATTRPSRPEETDGVDYFFLSDQQYDEMLAKGEFLENATVYDYRYGVPKPPIREALAAGKDVVFRTDIQGARYIKSVCPGAVTVFVLPPSWDELEWRLRSRATDTPEQLDIRLRTARDEMTAAEEFDHTLVNDDLNACVDAIERILAAERSREGREPLRL